MSIPDLTDSGDLPPGVYRASLDETIHQFGTGNRQRIVVGERLERIYRLAANTGHLARFVVFGSFVTNKPEPNDVDVFLIMKDSFQAETLQGEAAVLFDHSAADAHFGASVFWLRRIAALGGEQRMVEYWQVKRDGRRRGIVEIVEESNDT